MIRLSEAVEKIEEKHLWLGIVLALASAPILLIDLFMIGIVEARKYFKYLKKRNLEV